MPVFQSRTGPKRDAPDQESPVVRPEYAAQPPPAPPSQASPDRVRGVSGKDQAKLMADAAARIEGMENNARLAVGLPPLPGPMLPTVSTAPPAPLPWPQRLGQGDPVPLPMPMLQPAAQASRPDTKPVPPSRPAPVPMTSEHAWLARMRMNADGWVDLHPAGRAASLRASGCPDCDLPRVNASLDAHAARHTGRPVLPAAQAKAPTQISATQSTTDDSGAYLIAGLLVLAGAIALVGSK